MYQNKIAVAIKVGGRVLREAKSSGSEFDDTVFIPFGSEYTLYVKNMNSVRALVRFQIDDTDATEGVSIIVPANGFIELERFIKNANFNEGLKFKFIERTKKIEDGPRGIKVEDGLIRIEYEFEREPAKILNPPYTITTTWPPAQHHHHHYGIRDALQRGRSIGDMDYSVTANAASVSNTLSQNASAAFASATMDSYEAPRSVKTLSPLRSASRLTASSAAPSPAEDANEKGITVGGVKSDQSFHQGSWFPTDGVKHVMIIKILGETGKGKVEKAVTVKTKTECPTCGTKNKFGTKFCKECGTGLEVI